MPYSELFKLVVWLVPSVLLIIRFITNARKARLINDIPTSKIRSAAQGFTELAGEATVDHLPLCSPASGELCLWFRYKVDKRIDDSYSAWEAFKNGVSDKSFGLNDGTGVCYVYPNGSRLTVARKRTWFSDSPLPASFDRPQRKVDLSLKAPAEYRITEWLIKEGDFLYALGHFQTQRSASPKEIAKHEMRYILSEWKQDYSDLLDRFDANKDGTIDESEWHTARKAAYQEALAKARAEHNSDGEHILVPPKSPLPFIIANADPKRLAALYRHHAMGYAAATIAYTGFCFWLMA